MTTTRLLLVRHGQTVWHDVNRYAGNRSDIDLTPAGVDQAHLLARWAKAHPPHALVCSPVRRARETAQPAADALGLQVEVDPALREVDFGVAEGHTLTELRDVDESMVQRFTDDPVASPFPGAEPPEDAADRGAAALHRAAVAHPTGRVLVVAHNTLLRLALCRLLDLPVADYRRLFPRLDNGAVTEVDLPADVTAPASLVRLNAPLDPT